MQGCSLSIREDLLNNYAEEMVNYCRTTSNNSLQDALASWVYRVNEKEQHILQLDSVYREKHIAHDVSHCKRLAEESSKYRKYCTISG